MTLDPDVGLHPDDGGAEHPSPQRFRKRHSNLRPGSLLSSRPHQPTEGLLRQVQSRIRRSQSLPRSDKPGGAGPL
jgi:hypothetical protein